MNMYIVIVFNLKWQGVWHARLEERSPGVPGAVIKNTCLIALWLLSLQLWLFTASQPKPFY